MHRDIYMYTYIQPIAVGVSFNLNFQSQSHWSQQNVAKET